MNSLFDREYGYQYTIYEFASMRRLNEARINRANKLIGYITKLNNHYILRPTYTAISPYIICRSDREISNNVKVYGEWSYDLKRECLIFNIEEFEEIRLGYEILKDIISYERYKEILFESSVIDEDIKEILAHLLISKGEKPFRLLIRSRNADMLIKRLIRFLPREFIDITSILIKELQSYLFIKPILSLKDNPIKILYDTSEINLRLDSIYIYDNVDEFSLYDTLKFIISLHLIDIDYQTNYKYIIEYMMDNRLSLNSINTVLSLSIADAKIKRQARVEVENVRYIIELFKNTLKIVL